MLITPSAGTTVRLYSGIPIDPTYQNVLKFPNVEAQKSYFETRNLVKVFNNFAYITESSTIRVAVNREKLFNVNYVAFQNTNYGDKWFYAFVDGLDYYSPNATGIRVTLDLFASWQFELAFGKSFIIREHTNDDRVGANTIPENVELGPYITTSERDYLSGDLRLYMFSTEKGTAGAWQPPSLFGGVPVSCYTADYGSLSDDALALLKQDIDFLTADMKADAIISIFTAPQSLVNPETASTNGKTVAAPPRTLAYTPRNNKLYCYPFCNLVLMADGQSIELRYELFDGTPQLKIYAAFGCDSQVVMYPLNYEGIPNATQYEVLLKSWPTLPWIINAWQNWIANNKAQIVSNVVKGGVALAATVATGGMMSATAAAVSMANTASGAASGIADSLAAVYNASNMPDQMHGTAAAGDVNAYRGLSGFKTMCRTIRPEYAEKIDDYFSMYGYKTNKLKYPNITGREKWNFVQTPNAIIYGDCPKIVIDTMKTALIGGVTFWHTGEFEYTDLSNPII